MGFRYPGKQSWVTDQYKLISTDNGKTYELYDLINDPGEKNNIYNQNTDIANKLQEELENWLASFDQK